MEARLDHVAQGCIQVVSSHMSQDGEAAASPGNLSQRFDDPHRGNFFAFKSELSVLHYVSISFCPISEHLKEESASIFSAPSL